MRLIPNARNIALKAASMWANYLGILVLITPELLYALFERDTDPRIWFFVGLGLIVAGIVGRLVDQGLDYTKLRAWLVAALVLLIPMGEARAQGYSLNEFDAVAVPLIAKWEGLRTTAYLDTIASPPVWTACYGETKGVKQGDSYTPEQCREMLAREVREYREGLHRYFVAETKARRLTAERDAAYTSLAYNAGIRAIGRSTATRRLNAGDIAGGCKALGWWNKAGGRVVRGLVNRRADEVRLCLSGLS
jgi:GH24 family phage-related lysozyme (muramidase)